MNAWSGDDFGARLQSKSSPAMFQSLTARTPSVPRANANATSTPEIPLKYALGLSANYLSVEERTAPEASLVLACDSDTIRGLFFRDTPWAEREASGDLQVTGSRSLFRGLSRAFAAR